jgi:phosphoribosyl 1,2-cyclic phosphodiesterase
MLRFKNLGSGSAGNATVVEAGNGLTSARLLVDCGLNLKTLLERLAQAGLLAEQIDAVFITHEHSDHIGSASQFAQRFNTPLWMSQGTHDACFAAGASDLFETRRKTDPGDLFRCAKDGQAIDLGEMQITPFTVPHDAREPLQLRCTDGARHLGVLTDLGHATAHVLAHLAACDALLLECNHDADMLQGGRYPPFLKSRVGGQYGHLSNAQSAQIATSLKHDGLGHVVAAHLSRQNNRPELARAALAQALARSPEDIAVADQFQGSDWFTV